MDREQALREGLVGHLERSRVVRSPRIASALRAVDRHRFVPAENRDEAYADKALALKEQAGAIISSISQPSMVAQMLELLAAEPASRVLEIGTGSGYNAALLAELASDGTVVSIEIERDLLDAARSVLDAHGYRRIVLMHAEDFSAREPQFGELFDRIIVTARASDVDARWWRLLAEGGRLVLPLDIGYGGERVIGFRREGRRLRSFGSCACAFVALREYAAPDRHDGPDANAPLDVIAVEREFADASFLEYADAIVARPHTMFALTRAS
jgi:protein-L-isoaspartate(D-aspartate) O-methyltransferase